MKLLVKISVLCSAAILLYLHTSAQTNRPFSTTKDNRVYLIDSIFTNWYNSGKFSGNVLIAEKGKALYQKSFGLANEQTQQQLDDNSMFLLGSVSKQFTAFAIALLKEQGKLKCDDDIQKYLLQLPYTNIS